MSSFFSIRVLSFTLFVACLLRVGVLQAQLPAGSIAPDFAAIDINGNSWNLYEILAQDKVVVLMFFTTSCAPCWAYHQSKALEKFYKAYGPAGADRVRVFFLESDPSTNKACILGNPGCNGQTFGDWSSGVTFPIINNETIAAAYSAASTSPVLYYICPNRKIYPMGLLNEPGLWQFVSSCPIVSGNNNAGIYYFDAGVDFRDVCDSLVVAPSFELVNIGHKNLESAVLELYWKESMVQTLSWSGNLPSYGSIPLQFDSLAIYQAGELTAEIIAINGMNGHEDTTNNRQSSTFANASVILTQKILLRLRTDDFGLETYWEVRDENDFVWASGGNLLVGPDGGGKFPDGVPDGQGAYGDNLNIRDTIELPVDGCYSFHITDGFGDGICCAYGSGYYRLYALDNPALPLVFGGTFANSDSRLFRVDQFSSTDNSLERYFSWRVFPNPAFHDCTIAINAQSPAEFRVEIFNTLGARVSKENIVHPGGEEFYSFSVGELPPGIYWIVVSAGWKKDSATLVIQK